VKVSLVVPVKNEAHSIEQLIESAAAQTRPPEEVVIVDGGSSDGTAEIVHRWERRHSRMGWLRVIRAEEATPGKGRNIGVKNASHEWIAFTDAGIRAEPEWLEQLVEAAERDPQVEVVYGSYEPMTETFFERCAALAYVAPKQMRAGQMMRGPAIPSSLFHRRVWESVGGFPDLRAAEDLIFMNRVAEAGFKTAFAPGAIVWWQLRPTLSSTFRKFILYSMHNVQAGMQRFWHYGLLRQYLLWQAFFLLAAVFSGWWALVPVCGYLLRAAKSIWIRREERGMIWALNPAQFALVTVILLTIDLATFIGWAQAYWQPNRMGQDA
jgi:glycosyltransferase involved in cell wall biosynthesis